MGDCRQATNGVEAQLNVLILQLVDQDGHGVERVVLRHRATSGGGSAVSFRGGAADSMDDAPTRPQPDQRLLCAPPQATVRTAAGYSAGLWNRRRSRLGRTLQKRL